MLGDSILDQEAPRRDGRDSGEDARRATWIAAE